MFYRIPRRPTGGRAFGLIAMAALMAGIGTLAQHTANPLVVVGAVFVSILLLLVISVAAWFVAATIRDRRNEERLYRRQQAGLCTTCEFDLSGINSDQCPECGMPVFRRWVTPPVVPQTLPPTRAE